MFSKKIKLSTMSLSVMSVFSMGGCSVLPTATIDSSKDIAIDNAEKIQKKITQSSTMTRTNSAVEVINGLYVAGTPFHLSEKDTLPDFFDSKIHINSVSPISMQEIISKISKDLNIKIDLSPDAITYIKELSSGTGQKNQKYDAFSADFSGENFIGSRLTFSLNYNGTVKNLLDLITSKANVYWKWTGNKVLVYRVETKEFIFDGDNSAYDFSSRTGTTKSGGEQNEGGSKDSSVSSQETNISRKSSSQYDDLIKTIESIKSPEGRYSISEQQGIISVTDIPDVLERIGTYINEMNEIVGKRIAVRTEIYEVRQEDSGDFGVDLSAAYEKLAKFNISTTGSFTSGNSHGLGFNVLDKGSRFNSSKAIVNALSTVGNVSLVTTSTNFTTNGKIVPVQVATEKAYIQKITSNKSDDGTVSGYDITPGTVLSGVTMNITPKITSDGRVDMQFSADLSKLEKLVPMGSGETKIELPERSFKNFSQRVSIRSGSTLMVSGFERTEDKANTESIGGEHTWLAGGHKNGGKTKIITMILITPYIMSK